MAKKATGTTYMQDIIALAKKADVLHTAVIEEKIYISLDNAVLIRIPDNEKSNDVLQAIGIPYVREKQGEYSKKKGKFAYDERGQKISRASTIFYSERKDITYTGMIYIDGKTLMELYVQDGEVKTMNVDYMAVMHKINPEYCIGHASAGSQFIYVMDTGNDVAFGAMPVKLCETGRIAMKNSIEYLFGYVRGTMEEDGEAGR